MKIKEHSKKLLQFELRTLWQTRKICCFLCFENGNKKTPKFLGRYTVFELKYDIRGNSNIFQCKTLIPGSVFERLKKKQKNKSGKAAKLLQFCQNVDNYEKGKMKTATKIQYKSLILEAIFVLFDFCKKQHKNRDRKSTRLNSSHR